ncbi:MAG: M48 family metallopeptidase [Pseudomonadota bacterium]
MQQLTYLQAYPEHIQGQVRQLIENDQLAELLLRKYAGAHAIRTDKALYSYVQDLKNQYLRNGEQISKVTFDSKIKVIQHALGQHTYISRVQGNKLKSKHEIRVASLFKYVPDAFLKMIVVHELAHLKEKEHNKAFYKLCTHMEPNYHQYELDLRLYLTQVEVSGKELWISGATGSETAA